MKQYSDNQITIYETADGKTKLEVKFEGETVWLTQDEMAILFDKSRSTITEHIQNVFEEGELVENSVCRDCRRTGADGKKYKEFFATVQNKMHFAVHGKTAAEVIVARADSKKPNMGLTSFKGNYITPSDITIAKNYLTEDELKQLNLIVSLYLDFAELQAINQRPMTMTGWIGKLDDFLKLSEREILYHAGKISAKQAQEKAEKEFAKYKKDRDKNYISDFDKMVKKYSQRKTIKKSKSY